MPATPPIAGRVVAVCLSPTHGLTKICQKRIQLLAGLGVEGDAHLGTTVQHLSRVAVDPQQPNLRQVHLIHEELHEELRARGYALSAGMMGENLTTRGIDLLGLPASSRVLIGDTAVVVITGLRNPCRQLDRLGAGLMAAVVDRDERGSLLRKAGVMGIVITGGTVIPGDPIRVHLPPAPHRALAPV